MQSSNDDTLNKPLVFTQLKSSDNTTARINAEQVTGMIQTLMQHDRTIEPDDIAIIMAKSNDSDIYNQLEDTLDKLYERLGKGKNRVREFWYFKYKFVSFKRLFEIDANLLYKLLNFYFCFFWCY